VVQQAGDHDKLSQFAPILPLIDHFAFANRPQLYHGWPIPCHGLTFPPHPCIFQYSSITDVDLQPVSTQIPHKNAPKANQESYCSCSSKSLDALSSNAGHTVPLIESILYNDDVCAHDAVVIVEHPGVRFSIIWRLSLTDATP
jgi:hypothetical protein